LNRSEAAKQKATDVRVVAAELYLLPIRARIPLKFGAEMTTLVTCARVRATIANRQGEQAEGWGETPLSVEWVWPSKLSYAVRNEALLQFCLEVAAAWVDFGEYGHALEVGEAFIRQRLDSLRRDFGALGSVPEALPTLAALACFSPFDVALHDAYGRLLGLPTYETYGREFLTRDLSHFLESAPDANVDFAGRYPCDFFRDPAAVRLPVWHLVGGLDPLTEDDVHGAAPADGVPFVLTEWIRRDELKCLKIKLRGNDADWDVERMASVGRIARELGVEHLTADFNCMAPDQAYVNGILDRVQKLEPSTYDKILYVEQPFPYDLAANPLDVRSVAQRKPLLMDESANSWKSVRLGRSLGWTGVALKTCKTQTGAILSLCWAKAHGMHLMVQDLSNVMLAQIPHVQLAAHADTMMGVESNGMQFYPEASAPEAAIHPGLYRRRQGELDLSTLDGPGFGYRIDEISRTLADSVIRCETSR
jgi:L-alanine-DL-glutamate epimerase-like enolase superfamily enzyme